MGYMRFVKPHGSRSSDELSRLLPKKTHTPRRFISSLTVPLRFGKCLCERGVDVLDIQRYNMEAHSGNDRPSSFKTIKNRNAMLDEGSRLQFVFFVAAGAALSDVIVIFTN